MGRVHSYDAGHDGSHADDTAPLGDVLVASEGITDTTSSAGGYELEGVPARTGIGVTFSKNEYLAGTQTINLECGEDEVLDCELLCMVTIAGTIVVSNTNAASPTALARANVDYSVSLNGVDACGYSGMYQVSTSSGVTGTFAIAVPLLDAISTFTVMQDFIETKVFTVTIMDSTVEDLPFADNDCAWNPGATTTRDMGDQITCGFGMISGRVTVGGSGASGQTVQVIQGGVVVGSDTTGTNGVYIISGIPTECLSTAGCADFSVQCMAWTQNDEWDGCGDVEQVNFAF